MEQHEIELIEKYGQKDNELKALWDLHADYEQRLEKLLKKPALTPVEETEVRELKKKKLAGKTKLQQLLERYKSAEA